jgi:hypothetical protein
VEEKMKLTKTNESERLAEVQDIYSRASSNMDSVKLKFDKYDRQYRGDHDIDGVLVDDEGNTVETAAKAKMVWNVSHKLLEGSIDTSIPQPLVTPEFQCECHVRNARRIEGLIKMLLDKQPWEQYNDSQERTVKKFGTSGSIIEFDTSKGSVKEVGEAVMTPILPHHIYPQPGITDIDSCDYVFVDYITTRAEIMRKYGLSEEQVEHTTYAANYGNNSESSKPINDDDVVTLTVLWYKNESGDVCRFVYSGDIVLEDNDDYYARKVEYCETCGRRRQLCEKDECSKPKYYTEKLEYEELDDDVICSDGRVIPAMSPVFKDGKMVFEKQKMPVTLPDGSQAMDLVGGIEVPAFMEVSVPKMAPTRLPYYKPKKFPISVRYNIKDDNSFWGISDMEIIREPQQEINKLASRIQEAMMKYGAALVKPADAQVTFNNGIFDEIIELGTGMDSSQFSVMSYSVDVSPWVMMLDRLVSLCQDLNGVSDSFLGQPDPTAKSGIAKSISVNQSAGRLASRKVNKQSHFADLFRAIFELHLAFADEPRAISHGDGNTIDPECANAAAERFNRYDFYEYDPTTGKYYIDDSYTFACDPNGALEQQYTALWDLVKSDYASGLYGDPKQIDSAIFAWKHLERIKYPFAKDVVELMVKQKEQMMAAQAQAQQLPPAQGQTVPEQQPQPAQIGGQ